MKPVLPVLVTIALCGCGAGDGEDASRIVDVVHGPALPAAISNNAVAGVATESGLDLFTFMGLESGRGWQDITSNAWHLPANETQWQRIEDVPGAGGRLAATAVTVDGDIYVFGGYTVAEDGSEKSVETVFRLNLDNLAWDELTPMPVPVDDAVALVYLDRFVYLVSGWHDFGNVNLVQIYDTAEDRWVQATPWPGEPVFGQAGGIVGDTMVVCDGVAARVAKNGARRFDAVKACYVGVIDGHDRRKIEWHLLDHHPGPSLYRMAATGSPAGNEIVFAGGSDNPYNYDGIGYDGVASGPSARVFSWRIDEQRWHSYGELEIATMDHRGLVANRNSYFLIGGMVAGPAVSDALIEFRLPGPDE